MARKKLSKSRVQKVAKNDISNPNISYEGEVKVDDRTGILMSSDVYPIHDEANQDDIPYVELEQAVSMKEVTQSEVFSIVNTGEQTDDAEADMIITNSDQTDREIGTNQNLTPEFTRESNGVDSLQLNQATEKAMDTIKIPGAEKHRADPNDEYLQESHESVRLPNSLVIENAVPNTNEGTNDKNEQSNQQGSATILPHSEILIEEATHEQSRHLQQEEISAEPNSPISKEGSAAAGGEPAEENEQTIQEEDPAPTTRSMASRKRHLHHKEDEIDPAIIGIRPFKKKVPKRLSAHLWAPLPSPVVDQLTAMLYTYVEPTIMDYQNEKTRNNAQDLLNEVASQLSSKLERASLPPGLTTNNFDMDTLLRKKKHLEAIYSSDLKQVENLTKELQREQKIMQSDERYLNELTKTIRKQEKIMDAQAKGFATIKPVDLALTEGKPHSLNIHEQNGELTIDLDKDKEINDVLKELNTHLDRIGQNTGGLHQLEEKLTVVNNILEML